MQPLLPFAGAKGVGMEKAGQWGMYLIFATRIRLYEDSCNEETGKKFWEKLGWHRLYSR